MTVPPFSSYRGTAYFKWQVKQKLELLSDLHKNLSAPALLAVL